MALADRSIAYGSTLAEMMEAVYADALANVGTIVGQPLEAYTNLEINSNPIHDMHLELVFDSGIGSKVEAENLLDFIRVVVNAVAGGEVLANPQATLTATMEARGVYGPWFYRVDV